MKNGKFKIGKNAVTIIGGVSVILFTILILLSAAVPAFSFLSVGVLASIGFVGFWVFLPSLLFVGLYMIASRKLVKFKINLSLVGLMIIILASAVMCTNFLLTSTVVTAAPMYQGLVEGDQIVLDMTKATFEDVTMNKYLEINTFIYYFLQVSNLGFAPGNYALGGGFIGFMLCSMLNSAMTPVGTTIVSIVLIVIGIGFIFNVYITRFVKFILGKIFHKKKEETKEEHIEETPLITTNEPQIAMRSDEVVEPLVNEEEIDIPFSNPVPGAVNEPYEEQLFDEVREENKLDTDTKMFNTFNSAHSVRKAEFSFDDPIASDTPVSEQVKKEQIDVSILEPEPIPVVEDVTPNFVEEKEEIIPQKVEAKPNVEEQPQSDELSLDIASRTPRKAKPLVNYRYPSTNLIEARENEADKYANQESNNARMERINEIFAELNLGAKAISYTVGPTFTRFDIQMDSNRSVSTIDRFVPDIASRLGGISVRFQKLVIGKSTSGLEIPNDIRTNVGLRECLDALPATDEKNRTLIPFGKDIDNKLIYADLTKFPHMLVAGSTGSGKSVFVHSVIATLIIRNKPDELKLVLVDPKCVEMNVYHDIPHLLCPNISEPHDALVALNKLCVEMERRYRLFSGEFVNDIKDYNKIMVERGLEKLPYIIVIVDEYADLSESCKEIRSPVVRIAQKARAAGIHLIIATQRPSVNVIDGVIKANISTHVALSVNSYMDSNVILGENGAEQLAGNGDMIVDCALISRQNKPRLQGAYCSLGEINKLCNVLRQEMPPQYDPAFLNLKEEVEEKTISSAEPTKVDKDIADDALYDVIKEDIKHEEYCSISKIQRNYGIGFPRAGRMFARLQDENLVAKSGDAKGSKVLIYEPVSNEQGLGSVEQSTLRISDDV